METARGVQIGLLGPLTLSRCGVPVDLPPSRKVRALLAYLALTSAPVTRTQLCDLLWDVPNDPRGELRWCLSKLRSVLDDEHHKRVLARRDGVIALDLSDCQVDVREIDRAAQEGIAALPLARLEPLARLFGGELLDGTELDASPELNSWLAAQRHHYRELHVEILSSLATRAPRGSESAFLHLYAWLQRAPFDVRAHAALLDALAAGERWREAEAHVGASTRAFEKEGIDSSPLREAWQGMRRTSAATASGPPERLLAAPRRRGSVAVMPFVARRGPLLRPAIADGLTEDVITGLAKLRVLFVIARGTMYALSERVSDALEVGRLLGVEYVVSGSVRDDGARIVVVVELAETASARIVWTDEIDVASDDALAVLDTLVARIVASVAEEIETAESSRAMSKMPGSLDAWEAYHRGLWHMYKFRGPDNERAGSLFRDALQLDPGFARAHAALSFTHFQNAFLDLTTDRPREVERAFDAAVLSVDSDVRDPAAHWAMGRALWLRGDDVDSFAELRQSIELSPNFALGHYTLGWFHCQTGDPRIAIDATDHSRKLSPFDPLQFAMLASRALAHLRLGERAEAAEWAVKATGRPNAHLHIGAIAVSSLVLVERLDEARTFAARLRARAPRYGIDDFLRAFRFDAETTTLLRHAARRIGFDH